jgi:hypothetical protein
MINSFFPCDTLKLFNTMWFLQTVHTMWYLQQTLFYTMLFFQSVFYHVMHSNCVIPCDTLNLFYIMWYLQTVNTIWYIQTILCHVIPSNCFIPCDIFKLLYNMWYIQTVWWRYHMVLNILRVSHCIAKLECITWYKSAWRYHMVQQSLNASHYKITRYCDCRSWKRKELWLTIPS